ncbi:MAG: MBOAT family protein [Firmicutes bacterium]|nr:MBOAT family protein [Bacillota bacterium]
MLFSSITFLFYFLPAFLLVYLLTPKKYRNIPVLIFSLIFYFVGEPKYIIVLLLSCFINYFLSLKMDGKHAKKILILGIIYNVGQLLIFKYIDFFIGNINNLLNMDIPYTYITMPIGISFFTFQALGYIIDVYTKKHEPARNIWEFMTYIALFPQLIAGPIVRYADVSKELKERNVDFEQFAVGVQRFTIGLAKKVLIANVLGEFINVLTETTVLSSWLKPIAFTLQIYFDFSGYSDMAIGLGLMMGFKFLENFNYPLIADSITNFWRRWHMSLSSWFRDYVYIPLGGNRVNAFKRIRNILIVWFLTGFWHGAAWNFILWGIYFGVILIFEKKFLLKFLNKTRIVKYLYTLVIVIISFLIFSSDSLDVIGNELKNMFFINNIPFTGLQTTYYLKNNFLLLIISIIGATPLISYLVKKIKKSKFKIVIDIIEPIVYLTLLILCTAFLIDESFNPFLYFRF